MRTAGLPMRSGFFRDDSTLVGLHVGLHVGLMLFWATTVY